MLIVYDDIIPDMFSNKKLNPTVTELFIRRKKLNTSLVFITQSYFAAPVLNYFSTLFCYENSKQKRTSTNCRKNLVEII